MDCYAHILFLRYLFEIMTGMFERCIEMTDFTYRISDPEGLHALPAGDFVRLAESFPCSIILECDGKTADAKRVMQVMGLGIKYDDIITVSCDGQEETLAAANLKKLCERIL